MSSWPPNPNVPQPTPSAPTPGGQEWQVIERVLLASIEEQRRARRWNMIYNGIKLFFFLIIIMALSKSCTSESKLASSTTPHLAVVDINGEIGGSGSNSVDGDDVIKALHQAFAASMSRAVVLNINSPGGSPVQSDQVWQAVRRERAAHPDKKVYAVIGDLGASGAYYIASSADEIYVNPSSLVGSIGVIMPNYGVSDLAKKLGIEDRTMTSGAHKNILSMTRPLDPFEKAHVQGVLDNVHEHFIAAVKAGRGNRLKIDDNTFSGLFWDGEQAIKLGVADKAGDIETLKKELNVKDTVDYSVEHSPLDRLVGKMGSTLGQKLGATFASSFVDTASQSQAVLK